MLEALKEQRNVRPAALSMDSTSIKVHPDGTGARKKNGPQSIGSSSGGWNTKIHMLAANDRQAVKFSLSPGQAHDVPEGRKLLRQMGSQTANVPLLMDRAYEGDANRRQAQARGMEPVVPPKKSRLHPWQYDKEWYKKRNQVERLFRRLKGYRRVFSRFDKLDGIFMEFIAFAIICEILR